MNAHTEQRERPRAEYKLENVAIANALQLEAARCRAVPIPVIRRPCQV